ncbi:hypothetical protein pb186bvf_017775 [Paramecium bursaria]
MQQLVQRCRQANHNEEPVIRFCTFKYCLTSRYLCSICLEQNLHRHIENNLSHIVDPALFKDQVDQRVMQLKKILDLYHDLQSKIVSIWGMQGQKQEQLQNQLKKEQQRVLQLISQNNIQDTSISMISEKNIYQGSILIQQPIQERHDIFYITFCEYYNKIDQIINQLKPQLELMEQSTRKLQQDNIITCQYVKSIVCNMNVPIYNYNISREQKYLVYVNCIKQLYIYDLIEKNIIINYPGLINQASGILLVESDNNLIMCDRQGYLYVYKFNIHQKKINQQLVWDLRNGDIVQIFDLFQQNQFLLYCLNGKILVIDIQEQEIIRYLDIGYQEHQNIAYHQNLQIITQCFNGNINFYGLQRFDLLLTEQYEFQPHKTYTTVFSQKGNYLALYSQHLEFLELYSFKQKPQIKLSLFKSIQLQCINLQWVMNDEFIVIQTAQNTKIVDASNFQDLKIIQTQSINWNQCYESKQISYIIDFEEQQIVRYDC